MYHITAYKDGKSMITHKFTKFKYFKSCYVNLLTQMDDNDIDYNLILVRKYDDDNKSILGSFAVLKTAVYGPITKIVNMINGEVKDVSQLYRY